MAQYDDIYARRALDMETGDPIPGAHMKAVYDELGPQPRGTSSTVRDRLDGVESDVGQKAPLSHTHDAVAVTTGVIAPARLGSGSPGSGVFLRGDGVWSTIDSAVAGIIVLDAGAAVPSGTPVGTIILRRAS